MVPGFAAAPSRSSYDVVIVGGGIMGASAAWFLADNPDFDGSVLVLERDTNYEFASTTHTNSSIRQQFSIPLNIRISRFGAEYIKDFRARLGGDERVPEIFLRPIGYLYMAGSEAFAEVLRENQRVQAAEGAATEILTPEEIAAEWPFYTTDDLLLGSINRIDEGYWDGATVNDWWRRKSRERGVEWVASEAVAMTRNAAGTRVESVTLASGTVVSCGRVVNASGPRAALTARMAGIDLPVEPRKRYSYIFKAETPLEKPLPLTIDPSGIHVRDNGGGFYLAGGHTEPDGPVDFGDFAMDHGFWENEVWPAIATRVPAFERLKLQSEWAGHYAYNTLDQNAVCGPHPEVENFLFLNGFSGHGLQQSPAMGRGLAEWITQGAYRTLDLTPFHYDRILRGEPLRERAII